jgi:hypothetical protein
VLEVLVQRQQQALAEQQQPQRVHTPRQVASPRLPRSPTRSCSSPSSGAAMAAAAAIAVNSPVGGVLCSRDAALSEAPPSSNRLYKSEEWGFPSCSSGRKSFHLPIDPVGHRSFNSLLTPTSASGGLKVRLADSLAAVTMFGMAASGCRWRACAGCPCALIVGCMLSPPSTSQPGSIFRGEPCMPSWRCLSG